MRASVLQLRDKKGRRLEPAADFEDP